MKINYLSITFWFNVFNDHNEIVSELQEFFKDEYSSFNVQNPGNNLIQPIITAQNSETRTNMVMSKITFQYNMDKVDDVSKFTEKSLSIFEFLNNCGIEVLRSAILLNCEKDIDNSLEVIAKNTIKDSLASDDLVDLSVTLGKRHEDLFYKRVTLLSKKRIKFPKKYDKDGKLIPMPLVSWNSSLVDSEIIEVSYEINDKYSYDYTKNYHTTEFYLNKMLYILENDYLSDIDSILENGTFN